MGENEGKIHQSKKLMPPSPLPSLFSTFFSQIPVQNVAADLYICPQCLKPDDGSPMIGCDGCNLCIQW